MVFVIFFRFSGDISEQAKFQTYPDNYDTLSLSLSLSLKFHDSISILCPKYYLSCLWDSSFVCTKDSVDPLSSWLAV